MPASRWKQAAKSRYADTLTNIGTHKSSTDSMITSNADFILEEKNMVKAFGSHTYRSKKYADALCKSLDLFQREANKQRRHGA